MSNRGSIPLTEPKFGWVMDKSVKSAKETELMGQKCQNNNSNNNTKIKCVKHGKIRNLNCKGLHFLRRYSQIY